MAIPSSRPTYSPRLLLWEYFTRPPQRADWTAGKTFSGWARRYVERLSALL